MLNIPGGGAALTAAAMDFFGGSLEKWTTVTMGFLPQEHYQSVLRLAFPLAKSEAQSLFWVVFKPRVMPFLGPRWLLPYPARGYFT